MLHVHTSLFYCRNICPAVIHGYKTPSMWAGLECLQPFFELKSQFKDDKLWSLLNPPVPQHSCSGRGILCLRGRGGCSADESSRARVRQDVRRRLPPEIGDSVGHGHLIPPMCMDASRIIRAEAKDVSVVLYYYKSRIALE